MIAIAAHCYECTIRFDMVLELVDVNARVELRLLIRYVSHISSISKTTLLRTLWFQLLDLTSLRTLFVIFFV